MGQPRILHANEFFSLRKIGNNVFRILRVNELAQALGAPVMQARALKVQVVLVTHNAAAQIDQTLRDLHAQFAGHNWALLAVDNGSDDSTAETLQNASQCIFAALKKTTGEDARQRALTLARAVSDPEAMVLLMELGQPVEMSRTIESFCTVATRELWPEAVILIKSLRRFNREPVFVVCDEDTAKEIKAHKIRDVHIDTGAGGHGLEMARQQTAEFYAGKKRNNFHRPDAILKKMDAMEWAIEETGGTFFLDADIVPVQPIETNLMEPVCLSPHYHPKPVNGMQFGFFNAGYVLANDPAFPQCWRDLYFNRSAFYEQEGMTYLVEQFPVGVFDRAHNVGFWRRGFEGLDPIASFHVHLTFDLETIADKGLRKVYQNHRNEVLTYLKNQRPEVFEIVEEVAGE